MPWPGAGTQRSIGTSAEIRSPNPSRFNPAAASTSASYSRRRGRRSLLSTLPRTPSKRAFGASAQLARRGGGWCHPRRWQAVGTGHQALCAFGNTIASRGSSRGSTAPIVRPSGRSTGMSFALCTARSTWPASRASSISFTKTRFLAFERRRCRGVGASGAFVARRSNHDDLARPMAHSGERRHGVSLPSRETAAARPDLHGALAALLLVQLACPTG